MAVDITVLSYNIHHGEGRDGIVDLERLGEIISAEAPDLVALQEVDRGKKRSGYVNQVAELSYLTGMEAAYSVSIDSGVYGQYGNMVLSRLPILAMKTYPLPGEPRSLLETQIDVSDELAGSEHLTFYSTHLDLLQKPRIQSVPKIRKVATSFPGRRVILAGDMNATPSSPTMLQMFGFMQNATAGRDSSTIADAKGENKKQIDYILYRPASRWQVLKTRVINEPVASDHYPLLATLRLV